MQGLKTNTKPPLRLSEQEGVDCTYPDRDGCRGGWMATYWNWTKTGADTSATNPGGQVYDTYRPYEAKSGACESQDN